MIFVGNIVCNDELTSIPNNFNLFSFEDWESNDLPTLFIGWEETKKKLPNASILNKKINNNLYWTFSIPEKRNIFESDIKSFIKKSYDDFVKNIPFYVFDPLILNIKTTDELLEKLKTFAKSFTYLYGDGMVYIYHDAKIIAIDLNLLKFISFNSQEVLKYLREESNFFENKEKEFKSELKYFDIKYIPYLIYKDATKNSTTSVLH